METATFAAGCFWGVEEIFRTTPGVIDTKVGYTGGTTKDPTYQDVCTGETGHAEAVQITYDPEKVSYEKLLQIFWNNHNPTTRNMQGPDIGTQYRSAIFTHNAAQEAEANNSISALDKAKIFHRPIVTQVLPALTFYPAEDYHQKYLMKRGMGSCHISPTK
ncbi:peptide-methionine (S)-S-oxide reductase MsrA [Candidatus Peribacteria bacterium]|nr:peptide-methionine (S)-S-oxide reductase MsrA [Candidatus Peribacteria bacterium]MBM3301957.1 peptide-methionine (S)-S-oxide reductase MsrA [Deltaproteobacteria bacterium]